MDVAALRRAYAEKVTADPRIRLPGLRDAFAAVPRERFLGPGPWLVLRPESRAPGREKPDGQLVHIYDDVLVAIDPARHLNNGQPSAHALWIAAAGPRAGESVLHIGCGTGYYTAILAELVGGAGQVVGIDIDPALAERARANLEPWPHARVENGDGSRPGGPHDVIYLSAGATHARSEWLAALAPGGRLLLPLTVHLPAISTEHGVGIVIRAEVLGDRWPVRVVSQVGIFDCAGARDPEAEPQLRKLLAPEAAARIHVLAPEPHSRGPRCLLHVQGFCLQT